MIENTQLEASEQPAAPIPSWTDLTNEQQNAVLALTISRSVNEASRRFKTTTGRSRAYFYSMVYPTVKSFWKDMSENIAGDALRILRGGTIAAAHELVEEVKHRDVKIRNKASNDILGYALPSNKGAGVAVQINNNFNGDKYMEDAT